MNQAIQETASQVGVYECEVKLKFRLIEEDLAYCDRDQLLQILFDALSYGSDEYLESLQTEVAIQEVAEMEASPDMRRQLIRLRNASRR
ncbi:Npun_R1517 family heterocyst differentiation transcriptional regulator [Oscillatoria sp. CS-180]|uniref:Npun_R1517 family heterocyst differentiation transcriptional regulator n=1 Tax=Oscillatoria sp. CS-180 TaxID=3021720 RepID=UPI00232B115D|nr:Npun_R1517 family heterocyst differentiation transcriptional regulator [Oscillatoria sp. CS-180]MDB9529177.1 Npun_R1517 family heterocyst differentiation transcriptional regulator [Oscillatoria sp. CS-180]